MNFSVACLQIEFEIGFQYLMFNASIIVEPHNPINQPIIRTKMKEKKKNQKSYPVIAMAMVIQ